MFESTMRTPTTASVAKRSTGSSPQRATIGLSRFLKHGLVTMAVSHQGLDRRAKVRGPGQAREKAAPCGAGEDEGRRRNAGQLLRRAPLDLQAFAELLLQLRQDL